MGSRDWDVVVGDGFKPIPGDVQLFPDDSIEAVVRAKAQGCCGDGAWRGRFCQYHMGYLDGYEDGSAQETR